MVTEPCLGFTGDCSLIPEQFESFLPPDQQPFTCTQFPGARAVSGLRLSPWCMTLLAAYSSMAAAPPPLTVPSFFHIRRFSVADPDQPWHSFLVGLIIVGCSIPFAVVARALLEESNAPEAPAQELTWTFLLMPTLGKHRWRFDDKKPGALAVAIACDGSSLLRLPMNLLVAAARRLLDADGSDGSEKNENEKGKGSSTAPGAHRRALGARPARNDGAEVADEELEEAYLAGRRHAHERAVRKYAGIVLIYATWCVSGGSSSSEPFSEDPATVSE